MELKQVVANPLEIAYLELGQPNGEAVVALHGWPDDATTYRAVAEELGRHGFRVLAPYLRGFGPTRFAVPMTSKSGQLTALADDLRAFVDALGFDRFYLIGHDWGARAAYIFAALYPQRVRGLVALSVGYGTNAPDQALSYEQTSRYWYHWFFATPRGRSTLAADRRGLCRYLWRTWAPRWRFSEREFEETARSWDNEDWVTITLHSYQHRWGFAPGDPRYDELERRMAALPKINVPTIVLHGKQDGATLPETSAGKDRFFTAGYERRVLEVGHFIPREAPEEVALALRQLAR